MLPRTWTPEAAKAGVKQEDIEAANDQAAQAVQAGLQAELARIPALRAQATEMLTVLLPGPARGAVQAAFSDLDSAQTLWQRGSSLSYSSSGDRQR
jgi:hypothetical protein